MSDAHSPSPSTVPPIRKGLVPNLRFDVLSGFLVFLIAMPLCLGIAKASEYPPIAGIWTAVVGGLLTTFLSNSQLTIKGPAAGLIVVVASSVVDLGREAVPELPPQQVAALKAEGKTAAQIDKELQAARLRAGYPLVLGCAVVAGLLQVLSGLFRAGALGEMVPLTPVHGMLASIGITIMAKQLFPMLGIPNPPSDLEPIHVIALIPERLHLINWTVASVGLVSLAILIVFPYLKSAVPALKSVPAQLVVLGVAIPLGFALHLGEVGKSIGVTTLVAVPEILSNPSVELPKSFAGPSFDMVFSATGAKIIVMFWLIASIESLLSSQAIDMIDPWRRKTNQNRDLMATGAANMLCAVVGALPMISEIVRSKANIDNGARTKFANMFHGLFLLAFVLLLPGLINTIPMAALGAMLVFVGFRLASPSEFIHTLKIGPEQLIVYVTTIVVTLSTDLLIGVLSGIVLKSIIHVLNGASMASFFRPNIEVANSNDDKVVILKVMRSSVFSNWLRLKGAVLTQADGRDEVVVDFSSTPLVDHSTMEKLHQLEIEVGESGKKLTLVGLDKHRPLSDHPLAARKLTYI